MESGDGKSESGIRSNMAWGREVEVPAALGPLWWVRWVRWMGSAGGGLRSAE